MKCDKCGNEYPGAGYFAVPGICNDCFDKLPDEEKKRIIKAAQMQTEIDEEEEQLINNRVGFGKRFAAMLIDGIIVYGLQTLITMFGGLRQAQERLAEQINSLVSSAGPNFNKIMEATAEMTKNMQVDFYWTFVSIQLVILLYLSLEMMVGASLGKILLGIQIGTQNGKPAPTSMLVKRFLIKESYYVFALFSALTMWKALDYCGIAAAVIIFFGSFLIFSAKKITFHDMLAHTAVYPKNFLYNSNNNEN